MMSCLIASVILIILFLVLHYSQRPVLRDYDFIIVGQGLAGSLLAWQLIQQQQSVLVLDNQHHASASAIAAGIINPITGHRINITENFASFHQTATLFYSELEHYFKQTFFNPITQHRLLKTQGQFEYWQKRTEQSEYADYLGQFYQQHKEFKIHGFGFAEIKTSAYVSVNRLLNTIKQWLMEQHAYQAQKLEYQQISISDNNVSFGDLSAKQLVFCEGHQALHNPWLQHLPFKLAKGEILTLEIPNLEANMLNWGNWLIPADNHHFKFGSNFSWNDLSTEPTEQVKNDLLFNMKKYMIEQGSVIKHQAGIRPTTTQRKPFIGSIGEQNKLFCFNGFGSKGCLLIPHYAQLFCNHLLHNKPLPEEVTLWL